ncbi:MAG TPA: membrane protein insertase YidC, partial [Pyrinomonadaceae bacterium]|nr:membrane protein insertase YidC [Pyrinomonadaceae bacterium]
MKQQHRFLLALVASAAVLILWNYFFPPPKPPQNANANTSANANAQAGSPSPAATTQAAATVTPTPAQASASPAPTPDNLPQRKLRIVTPLYAATFDTRGAVATSWTLLKVKRTDGSLKDVFGAGSTKNNPQPLELIPTVPAGVSPDQFFHPFQITTGDATLDATLANRNYRASGVKADSGDETINVNDGSKQIDFVFHDEATGLDVTKRLTFFADKYVAQLELKVARNNQPLPEARLVIGPSVGDQSIEHYSFYLYAPEGIAMVNGEVRRINSLEVHAEKRNGGLFASLFEWLGLKSPVTKPADHDSIDGQVQWAGVDDTYFSMVAVPSRPTTGLVYRTVAFEHKTNGKAEQRFLATALVPVPVDGTKTLIYAGPKDHRLLAAASDEMK